MEKVVYFIVLLHLSALVMGKATTVGGGSKYNVFKKGHFGLVNFMLPAVTSKWTLICGPSICRYHITKA